MINYDLFTHLLKTAGETNDDKKFIKENIKLLQTNDPLLNGAGNKPIAEMILEYIANYAKNGTAQGILNFLTMGTEVKHKRSVVSAHYDIPYRTLENWCTEEGVNRHGSQRYVLNYLAYILIQELY